MISETGSLWLLHRSLTTGMNESSQTIWEAIPTVRRDVMVYIMGGGGGGNEKQSGSIFLRLC